MGPGAGRHRRTANSGKARGKGAARAAALHQEAEDDAELVRRFNAGDDTAFVETMQRYREKIFSLALALALVRNRADAEKIAQNTLTRAHCGLGRFRGDATLTTWRHRITTNQMNLRSPSLRGRGGP